MGIAVKKLLIILLSIYVFHPVTHAHAAGKDAEIAGVHNTTRTKEVAKLVEKYIVLKKNFDNSLLDMYADDAWIYVTRLYAGDIKRKLKIKMPDYKEMGIKMLHAAKTRHEESTYSNFEIKDNHGIITVTADRFLHRGYYSRPVKWVYIKDDDGQWKIFEEHFTMKAF